jgi:hypothetical protein
MSPRERAYVVALAELSRLDRPGVPRWRRLEAERIARVQRAELGNLTVEELRDLGDVAGSLLAVKP